MTLREHLSEKATEHGWTVHDRPGDWFNLQFARDVGDLNRLEGLFLRLVNGRITIVEHSDPSHDRTRKITQRKLDHVHALLRARVVTAEELIR